MLARLTRIALRKGILGGSKPWLALGATLVGVRVLRFAAADRPECVFRQELAPGDTLRIASRRVP